MALTTTQINELYVAYFGRPADFTGLQYYLTNNATADQVAQAFSTSQESINLYGTSSVTSIVNNIYLNLFNRAAEPAGLTYWVTQIVGGKVSAAQAARAIADGAAGTDQTTVVNKVLIANAFVTALDTNPEIVGYSGDAAASSARAFLATVTATNLAATQAQVDTQVAQAVALGGGNGATTVTLTTGLDTLTGSGGNDIYNADNTTLNASDTIDGGAGTDTLNYTDAGTTGIFPAAVVKNVEVINIRNVNGTAAVAAVAEVAQVTFADVAVAAAATASITIAGRVLTLTGAAVTGTTFTAAQIAAAFATGTTVTGEALTGAYTNYTAAAGDNNTAAKFTSTVSGNVPDLAPSTTGGATVAGTTITQGVAASASTGIADTIDASTFIGATNFNSNLSTNAVTFNNLSGTQQVGITGNGSVTNGNLTANYTATATAATLNVVGGTKAGAVAITGTGLTSATINSTTAANTLTGITLANTITALTINAGANLTTGGVTDTGLKTVVVTGAATTVDLGTLASTALVSVDASAMTTGGVKVGIGANAATTFKGGAGADTVTIADTVVMTGTVDGGAGTDTLALTSALSLTTATGKLFTNFETLQVAANGTDQSYDPTLIAGITAFKVAASTNVVELKNLAAAPAVTVNTGTVAGLTLTLKDATGSADSVDVTLNNGNTNANSAKDGSVVTLLKAVGVETINLHSAGLVTTTNANSVTNDATNNTSLSKVVIDGSQLFTFVTGALAQNVTVDGSTATGNLTVTGTGATKLLNVNGGTGNDTITAGGAGGLIAGGAGGDSITVGAGVDTLVYKAATDSVQDFTGTPGVAGKGTMDVISAGFATGTDKIDLTSLAFTTATTKTAVQKTFASIAALTAAEATATFYQDAANITRGVVVATVTGGDTYLVVDANHDGAFSAASDLVVKFTGAQAIATGDIIFG